MHYVKNNFPDSIQFKILVTKKKKKILVETLTSNTNTNKRLRSKVCRNPVRPNHIANIYSMK